MQLPVLQSNNNPLSSACSEFGNVNLMNNFGRQQQQPQQPGNGNPSPPNVPQIDMTAMNMNVNMYNPNSSSSGNGMGAPRPGQKRPADDAGMGMGMGMGNNGGVNGINMGMNLGMGAGMGDAFSLNSQLNALNGTQGMQMQGNSTSMERPNKRAFNGETLNMNGAGPEEKLGSPNTPGGLPLRNNLMGASSLLGQGQGSQGGLSNFQNSLLASSLANRHAELAQRQLLQRYFSPQLRLNNLPTSLATPSGLGLGSFTGHQLPGTANSSAPGPGLAAFLSRPGQDQLQSMARFQQEQQQQQQQQHQQGGFNGTMGDNFQQGQCLPATANVNVNGSQHSQPQRLQDMNGGNAGVMGSMSNPAAMRSSMLGDIQSAANGMGVNATDSGEPGANPIPLGIEEDPNWLSDYHVFVRLHLVELCWASSEDVALRTASNRVSSHQVGIRCRCCAHLNPSARAQRSSAFPSSIAQIYQSFTMMLRAHFSSCTEVPPQLKEKFLALKSKTTQGATDSKQYWIYSARKLGMVDSDDGIVMTKVTTAAARSLPPFGSDPATGRGGEESSPLPLVAQNDRHMASDFLYTLMMQSRRVRLQANEQRGNKKSLQLGLPGFACRHCTALGRMGQCRIFPARRRTLPAKIYDLYEHLQRCTACPQETKELLEALHGRENYQPKTPGHKEFLDTIWSRLVEQQHT